MRIAVFNSFPNQFHTAEKEFIARFCRTAQALEHEACEVITSRQIFDFDPDFVIATHDCTPKLTPHLTLGAMWSPAVFTLRDEMRMASALTYDAHLVGSPSVRAMLSDIEDERNISIPKSPFLFLPVAQKTSFTPHEMPRRLAYVGVHWDGPRHDQTFDDLRNYPHLDLFGPADAWQDQASCYRGDLPFDGVSVINALRRSGIALCLHRAEHRRANTPSMRLFESAAAGCVIISDDIPFAQEILGDSALYLNEDARRLHAGRVIRDHVEWIRAHPAKANAMAEEAHRRMQARFTMDKLIDDTCRFAEDLARSKTDARATMRRLIEARGDAARVDIVLRTGTHAVAAIETAVRSVAQQEYVRCSLIMVDDAGRAEVELLALRESRVPITYIKVPHSPFKSAALWTGLRAVNAPFFAVMEGDQTIAPEHVAGLLADALAKPERRFVHSAAIRVSAEGQFVYRHNYEGSLHRVVEETRDLEYGEGFIAPNAWIASRSLLDDETLVDPELRCGEDLYLNLLLIRKTAVHSTYKPTAFWRGFPEPADEAARSALETLWQEVGHRIRARWGEQTLAHPFTDLDRLLKIYSEKATSKPFFAEPNKTYRFTERLLKGSRHVNFHRCEPDGVWTGDLKAFIDLALSRPMTEGTVILRCKLAATGKNREMVELKINDGDAIIYRLEAWKPHALALPFRFASPADRLKIYIRRDALRDADAADGGGWKIGVFCEDISIRGARPQDFRRGVHRVLSWFTSKLKRPFGKY